MKLVMVLPLFSEYGMKEYLGIELIVHALKENGYRVDLIDMNEKLVDHLLSKKTGFHETVLQKIRAMDTHPSPAGVYAEHYLQHILTYDSASALKKDRLFDNFFKTIVLQHLDPGMFPADSPATAFDKILHAAPVLESFLFETGAQLCDRQYDAVLVSVPHAHQLVHALLFSKMVKSFNRRMPIIFGGSTITLSDEAELQDYVRDGFVDYYIKYSGEEKLLSLLVDLEENEAIDQTELSKMAYVDINKQVIAYRTEQDLSSVPVLYSRGCYWGKCTYCTYVLLDSGQFTRKKISVLLSELKQFSNKPVRISLITETLTPHDARTIAEGILEKNIRVRWGSFIRVNRAFDTALFSLLRESGCLYSCVGVESVNDKILKFYNKGYTKEDVTAFFRSAREAHFQFFQVNFMYGAPVADIHDELDNIQFISEFRDVIGNIAFFRLEITKKSYLGQHLEDFHIQIDPTSAARAIRLDVIPYVPSLDRQSAMVLERAYGIAGEYCKIRDVKASIRLFLRQNETVAALKNVVLFELDGHCIAGSLKSFILREVSADLFSKLKTQEKIALKDLKERDLFTLFELGVVDTEPIVYGKTPGAA